MASHNGNTLFKEELGIFTGGKITIHIDPSLVPKFYKARPLPYLMKEMVKKALQIRKLGNHKLQNGPHKLCQS